jgi:flavin reductase
MGGEGIALDGLLVPGVDVEQFKSALSSFATGVTIAATAVGNALHGATANAVMSVSLDPPLIVLSIQQGTRMHGVLQRSDNYALSILAADQKEAARYFADSSQAHGSIAFDIFGAHPGPTGAPLLNGALAHVDCRIVDAYPAGDHTLYIGRVVYAASRTDGEPLLYYRKHFLAG